MKKALKHLILAVPLLLSMNAIAGEAQEEKAKALFAEGRALYNDWKFEEASASFKAAYEARPNFKLLYNIAQSEASAKRYWQALEVFEQYLADGGDEISVKRQQEVSEEIERLKGMLGFLEVETERGAEIYVDGELRGTAPVHGGIPVVAGKVHTVEVVVNGERLPAEEVKVTSRKTVTLAIHPGKSANVAVAATGAQLPAVEGPEQTAPVTVSPREPAPGPVETPASDPVPRRVMVAGWVMLGVATVSLGVGVVTGALVLGIEEDLDENCRDDVCPSSQQDTMNQQQNLAVTSTVMLAVGGVSAATAVVLLVAGQKRAERISAVPALGPRTAGAVVSVTF